MRGLTPTLGGVPVQPPRPIGPWRATHAADALTRAREQLATEGIRPGDEQSADLYARAVLAADDDFGAGDGLVVQGDEITWRQLDALLDLAMLARLAHGRLLHPDVDRPEDCEWCDRGDAMWHSAVIDPLTARRGTTASEVDAEVRAALETWQHPGR